MPLRVLFEFAAPLRGLATIAAIVVLAFPVRAETIGGNPGPEHNYVCPHADGQPALECFFDAVSHLYTMCRNVKAIEIIEFGYEKSMEGTNGAKSESCFEKQKQNIEKPYRAALRAVAKWQPAVEALRHLQAAWVAAMNGIGWRSGESDGDYKARVAKPYDEFTERIVAVRSDVATAEASASAKKPVHARSKAKPAAKGHGATKRNAAKAVAAEAAAP
jgi:hypothetical protein